MSKRSARRPKPRTHKRLNLGGPNTITFWVVRFMVRTPDELREGTDAPEWIKRESPPTLNEDEAAGAYQTVLDELMTTSAGIRSPQLVQRTVTEEVLRDYDTERGFEMSDAMQEELDAAGIEFEPPTIGRTCRVCGCATLTACDTPLGPCGWQVKYDDNTGICTACDIPAENIPAEFTPAELCGEPVRECSGDCPGCMCPSGNPPCGHCTAHSCTLAAGHADSDHEFVPAAP